MNKKILLLSAILFLALLSEGQNPPGNKDPEVSQLSGKALEQRLNYLESKLIEDQSHLRETLELKMQMTHEEALYDSQKYLFTWMFSCSFVGFVGLVYTIVRTRRWTEREAKKFASAFIEEKSPELLTDALQAEVGVQKNKIRALIQSHELERQIREERRFLVITHPDPGAEAQAREVLISHIKFEKAEFSQSLDFEQMKAYQLIVLWGGKKPFEESTLERIFGDARAHGNMAFVYYINFHCPMLNNHKDIANAANAPFTLYGNIIQTLLYFDLKNNF